MCRQSLSLPNFGFQSVYQPFPRGHKMTRPYKVEEFNSILNKLSPLHKGKRRNLASFFVNRTGAFSVVPLLFALCFSAIPGFDIPLEGGTRGNHTRNERPAAVRDVNIAAYIFSRRSGGVKVNKRMATLHKSNTTLPYSNKVSILSSLTLINPNKSDGDGLFFFLSVYYWLQRCPQPITCLHLNF